LRHDTTIVVADSKEGWANPSENYHPAYCWSSTKWDVRRVRPAGARLVTFGGGLQRTRTACPLFEFLYDFFQNAKGRRLTPLECHDLMCMVADVVVVGGVRRSAMISLSDLGSEAMAKAKSGSWWEGHVYRQLANNSAVYNGKPEVGEFLKEWKALYDSKSRESEESSIEMLLGESLKVLESATRITNSALTLARKSSFDLSSSATLQKSLSDLKTIDSLKRKVRLATILGTIQSTFTNFKYLRKVWQKNTEEERLLGVSLTGIADNPDACSNGKLI
jgi:ribonucleoside-triphosphate reductase